MFLSISLFRLIPAGINQLASATVSLTQKTPDTVATTTQTVQKDPTPAPVTEDGLNGAYDNTDANTGDIVVLEKTKTTTSVSKTPAPSYTSTQKYYTRTYVPVQLSGRKNLKVTFTSIGIIQNGIYTQTNSFNTANTVSMRFVVSNEEDTPTGTWSMRVEMPATGGADKVKVLNNLNSIPGVSSYTGEVRFDGIDLSQGTPVIRVYLDVYNQVAESNENDNLLAVELKNVISNSIYNGTYYNTNYYNNCYNGSYYYPCTNYDSGYYNGNNNTTPNLYISSLEIGRYSNGTFYPQTTFNYGDTVTVRARVRNNGGYFNNSWQTRLSVYDANNYSRDITNGNESPLSSNGETTVTYDINNLTRGSNRLTFYADTQNNVSESNEGDNTSQITIQVY